MDFNPKDFGLAPMWISQLAEDVAKALADLQAEIDELGRRLTERETDAQQLWATMQRVRSVTSMFEPIGPRTEYAAYPLSADVSLAEADLPKVKPAPDAPMSLTARVRQLDADEHN